MVRLFARIGVALIFAAVVGAPLAIGGVHRVPQIILMVACAVGLGFHVVGSVLEGRPLRTSIAVVVPLVFLLVPILQSIPLPMSWRGWLDPNGNSLLNDNEFSPSAYWPLSLDPSLTRESLGKAAAALVVFLVSFHAASGKSLRHFLPRLVGLAGVVAVASGLGHRILGITEVYGFVEGHYRSLLTGPFVNANHSAEFFELATFACLACAFQRNNALNRYGWLAGMLVCAVGALGTLSRGSLIAGFAGFLAFVVLSQAKDPDSPSPTRRGVLLVRALVATIAIGGVAAVLGAGAIIDRFRATPLTEELRFQVWRDSLHVLQAHPLGIGRGAFERVYPGYRTLKTTLPVTFAFVENHPLQLLIDSGWPFFGLIAVALAVVLRHLLKGRRRDKIEAALLAGLIAVAAHSLVDFGLETLGVLLPFMAILGTVLGRSGAAPTQSSSKAPGWALLVVACSALVVGAASIAHSSHDDFDKLLKTATSTKQARDVLVRAQRAHPTDYFYALMYARTEPLRAPQGGRSPRLHALNRALRLCPGCDIVHVEVARNLWQLKSRGQAIVEWRTAVQLQPTLFQPTLDELTRAGATPLELVAVASFDPRRMVEVAGYLSDGGKLADAIAALDQADAMGAPRGESLLIRARLHVQGKHISEARAVLAEALAAGVQDPRMFLLEAQLILAEKGAPGADEAFSKLDLASQRFPFDLPIQRMRIDMVSAYRKWHAVDRAVDGLKLALYHAQGSAVEANVAAARIRAALSQWNAAFGEYRVALGQTPSHVALWIEFGGVAEKAGRDQVAREAYSEAARLSPGSPEAKDGLVRLTSRRDTLKKAALDWKALGAGSP